MDRAYRHAMATKDGVWPTKGIPPSSFPLNFKQVMTMLKVLSLHGLIRSSRGLFWRASLDLYRNNKAGLKGFFSMLAMFEHFYVFRNDVQTEIEGQLALLSEEDQNRTWSPPEHGEAKVG